ncbi:M81 family metallopeptidase, partial [Glaesserella parasuis]|uniref:M81 family metallopeptidase n=1 Tax=Glaesserella parasuis TaxID=738 RepID=UPI003B81EA6A
MRAARIRPKAMSSRSASAAVPTRPRHPDSRGIMARIAVGGFQHETNTFAPLKAEWRYFVE